MKVTQVRQYALSLPEATEEPHFDLTSFRVGGKIFATSPMDGTTLNVFVEEEERELHIAAKPEYTKRFAGVRTVLRPEDPVLF